MLFIVINGMFAFLFSKLPFCTQFLLVIYFFDGINAKNAYEK